MTSSTQRPVFIWVDQYLPFRLHCGWTHQLHQQLVSLPGHLLDMGSYTNELVHLSLVCTCLTDVTYWQFTLVFKRWRRDKSQLLIHNRGLRQCHSFTGRSPIFLYEQLKLAGAASGLPGDHGPAKSLFFSVHCNFPPHSQTSGHEPCRFARNRWYQNLCSGSFRHRCLFLFHSNKPF